MMMGAKMESSADQGQGRMIGSHIEMSGKVFGLALALDEVITERRPPEAKTWETVGTPRLLVIGPYLLGFTITPYGAGSEVAVFIDYDLPASAGGSILGRLFGGMYARWCVEQMLQAITRRFGPH
jgi:hypothetical protein